MRLLVLVAATCLAGVAAARTAERRDVALAAPEASFSLETRKGGHPWLAAGNIELLRDNNIRLVHPVTNELKNPEVQARWPQEVRVSEFGGDRVVSATVKNRNTSSPLVITVHLMSDGS